MQRPTIGIPGRFSEKASALRFPGIVIAEALLEAVWQAGGEPVVLHPARGAGAFHWAARLRAIDGVLLPGGGDVEPERYNGDATDSSLSGVNPAQDDTDISLARYAVESGVPLLAICRGMQVLNVALGGSLIEDMPIRHRDLVHAVHVQDPENHLGFHADVVSATCYHHQAVDRLAPALTVLATSEDGCIEAVNAESRAWVAGLQWHPEYAFTTDAIQLRPFERLVDAAAQRRG